MVDNQLQVDTYQLVSEIDLQSLTKVLPYSFDHEHILPLCDEFHEFHEIELNQFLNLLILMLHQLRKKLMRKMKKEMGENYLHRNELDVVYINVENVEMMNDLNGF